MEKKIKFISGYTRFFIFVLVLLVLFVVGEVSKRVVLVKVDGESRLLMSKIPIEEEDKQVITIPKGEDYYSKKLKISLNIPMGVGGQEHIGIIKLKDESKKGEITIERYKTEYASLEDAQQKTKNKFLKNAIKHNFETQDYVDGKMYDIKDPVRRIYFFHYDGHIYSLEATDPDMYMALGDIAKKVRFAETEYDAAVNRYQPKWVLRKEHDGGVDELFELERNGISDIIRWKDTLIYTYMYSVNNALSIMQHDIKTGETITIFMKDTNELSLYDINIIDNVLYITLGEYLRDGESYWIDLNSKDKTVHKLADIGGAIEKIKNRHYFIKGEGDACWGKTYYSLIDLDTKKITKVADTAIGCIPGDEYLGINNNDQMILSTFTGVPESEGYGYQEANLYTNVILIPLSTPSARKYLMPPHSMPPGILSIKYSDKQDEILMIGDSVYIYSFDTNKSEKVVDLPKEWIEHKVDIRLSAWNEDVVCVSKYDWGGEMVAKYLINTDTKQVSLDTSQCPAEDTGDRSSAFDEFPETRADKVKKIFNGLNLPSNYGLVRK